ncbi:MAG: Ribosomal large subunit pseudouridine synthase B [Acidimicrobiales bacterium AG-410-I20]|nr:MAG: Ribosomal large subunit pseudouridine synthase B [Acidimicrobiales bacterium AG-410-I20]
MSDETSKGERLQKVLARVGFGSRRACEQLILDGKVKVNGQQAQLGSRVEVETDLVTVEGAPIGVRPDFVYYLLNKPLGVVTTADDPQGRPTVVEMVPENPRIFPVGRLDSDTEGLLILTNNGELTHRLTHPSFGVEKEYVAVVEGKPARSSLRLLREGVVLEDGKTAPAKIALIEQETIRLTIHEGRNRQVRRMCSAVGHPVKRLVRTRIGPLSDRSLSPGSWRELTTAEIRSLEKSVADSN